MFGFILVLKAEITRTLIIMRRYWFASILGLAMGYGTLIVMVYGLMFAAQSEVVQDLVHRVINGILGFLIGVFAFGIVGLFTQGIQGMARTGELEQLCLSPFGLVVNFLARSFVAAVTNIFSSAVMLILVAATVASGSLYIAPFETIVLLGLTYINLMGFGFMVGGLVLVLKQVGQVAMIIRFAMVALAIFATEQISEWHWAARSFAHALPITDAAICLKYVLIGGQQRPVLDEHGEKIITDMVPAVDEAGEVILDSAGDALLVPVYETVYASVFTHQSFFFLIISCVIWSVIGIACFKYMENWSRDKGTLGAY